MARRAAELILATLAAAFGLAAPAGADPAAWRVTSESGSGGSLQLLGSVHYLRESDYPLPPVIDSLYDSADAVVMELDLDDVDPLATQTAFVGAALLPDGQTLPDVLAPDVYRLARQQAAELGIDLTLLERFEPWLVALTLLNGGMAQRGFSPDGGVEQYLLRKAGADGKDVLGLETLDVQIGVFDRLSTAEQAALLEQTLAELASPEASIEAMVGAWRDGRLDTLAEELTAEFEAFPELYDAIVVERNEAWIAELERLVEDGRDYLVVVGALHLVGEHSVVDLLRQRGFTVETVDWKKGSEPFLPQ